jgi:hypothetical protein
MYAMTCANDPSTRGVGDSVFPEGPPLSYRMGESFVTGA